MYIESHPQPLTPFTPFASSFEGSPRGLGSPSSLPANPQQLLFYKQLLPITNLESTLLEVFILRNLKSPEINTFQKTGRGVVTMANHLLETSHPLSSSALRLCAAVAAPSFHSPYTLPSSVSRKSCICHSYRNTGGWGYSSQIGTALTAPRPALANWHGRVAAFLSTFDCQPPLCLFHGSRGTDHCPPQSQPACPCYHRGAACASTEKASLNDRAHP